MLNFGLKKRKAIPSGFLTLFKGGLARTGEDRPNQKARSGYFNGTGDYLPISLEQKQYFKFRCKFRLDTTLTSSKPRFLGGPDSTCLRTYGAASWEYTGAVLNTNPADMPVDTNHELIIELENDGVNTDWSAILNGEIKGSGIYAQIDLPVLPKYIGRYLDYYLPGYIWEIDVWTGDSAETAELVFSYSHPTIIYEDDGITPLEAVWLDRSGNGNHAVCHVDNMSQHCHEDIAFGSDTLDTEGYSTTYKGQAPADTVLAYFPAADGDATQSRIGPAPEYSYAGNLPDGSGGVTDGSVPPLHGEDGVWLGPGYTTRPDNASGCYAGIGGVQSFIADQPDYLGGTTAYGVREDSATQARYVTMTTNDASVIGDRYSGRFVVKAGSRRYIQLTGMSSQFGAVQYANFDLQEGTITAQVDCEAEIKALGDGWFEIRHSAVATDTGVGYFVVIIPISASDSIRVPSEVGSNDVSYYISHQMQWKGYISCPYVPPGTTVESAAGSTSDNGIRFDLSGVQEVTDGVELFVDPDELYVDENNYSTYDSETGICTIVTDGTNVTLNISDALTIGESYEITCQVIENIGQEIVSLTTSFGTGITFSETSDPITAVAQHTTLQVKRGTGLGGRLTFKLSVQKIITAEEPLSKALRECYEGAPDGVELCTNGDFSNGTTGWSNYDENVSAAVVDEKLQITHLTGVGTTYIRNIIGVTAGERYKITADYFKGTSNGDIIVRAYDGAYAHLKATSYITPGEGTIEPLVVTATDTTLRVYLGISDCDAGSTHFFDNISVQKLNPALSTTAALVKMGVGSDELADLVPKLVIATNDDAYGTLHFRKSSGGDGVLCQSNDGTGARTLIEEWDRNEGHLMIVQQDGTNFRVGSKRYAEDGTEIDTDPVWSDWASFDGSFDPLDALRLALNGTVPLWLKHLVVWDKVATEAELLASYDPAPALVPVLRDDITKDVFGYAADHSGEAAIGFDVLNRACIQGDGSSVYVDCGVIPTVGKYHTRAVFEWTSGDTGGIHGRYWQQDSIVISAGGNFQVRIYSTPIFDQPAANVLLEGVNIVEVSYSGSTATIEINGEVAYQGTHSLSPVNESESFEIGTLGSQSGHYPNKIIEVELHGRVYPLTEGAGEVIHGYDSEGNTYQGQLYADDIEAAWSEIEGSEVENHDWLYGFSRRENLLEWSSDLTQNSWAVYSPASVTGAKALSLSTSTGSIVENTTMQGDSTLVGRTFTFFVEGLTCTAGFNLRITEVTTWKHTTQSVAQALTPTDVYVTVTVAAGATGILPRFVYSDSECDITFGKCALWEGTIDDKPDILIETTSLPITGRQPGTPGNLDAAGLTKQHPPYFWGNVDHEGAADMQIAECMRVYLADTTAFARGENLVTNGDFATNDLTGWTVGAKPESFSVSDNALQINHNGEDPWGRISPDISIEVGDTVLVEFDLNITSGYIYGIQGLAGYESTNLTESKRYSIPSTINGTILQFLFTAVTVASIDDVVIKKYSPLNALFCTDKEPLVLEKESRITDMGEELIVDLNDFATQSLVTVNSTNSFTVDENQGHIANPSLTSGSTYRLEGTISGYTSGLAGVSSRSTDGGSYINANGDFSIDFVADGTVPTEFRMTATIAPVTFSNLTLREVEAVSNNCGGQAMNTNDGKAFVFYPEPLPHAKAEKVAD